MKKLIGLAVVSALLGGSLAAQAATLNTTTATPNDGILQNFSGIDWHDNGAGMVQGFNLSAANTVGDTDTFTFTYQAFATAINTSSPTPNLRVAPPGPGTGSYELTTFATLTETATCLNAGCSAISIAVNSGSWTVYFDISPDANQAAGTGFTDGAPIISGTWDSGTTVFLAAGGTGNGGGTLTGTVTNTDNAYVDPDLVGTDLQASLIFPGLPDFTRPAQFDGVAACPNSATCFVLQTDTSQTFTQATVPEPATLALAGLGLLGMGLGRRRT